MDYLIQGQGMFLRSLLCVIVIYFNFFYSIRRWRNDEEIMARIGTQKFISYNIKTTNLRFLQTKDAIWSSCCVPYSFSSTCLEDKILY